MLCNSAAFLGDRCRTATFFAAREETLRERAAPRAKRFDNTTTLTDGRDEIRSQGSPSCTLSLAFSLARSVPRGDARFDSWLHRIMINEIRQHRRRNPLRRFVSLPDDIEARWPHGHVPCILPDGLRSVEAREARIAIVATLNRVPAVFPSKP